MANVWLLRAAATEPIVLETFKSKGIIAIGWSETNDLTGKSKEELKDILNKAYGIEGIKLGNSFAIVNIFLNEMQPGDFVLTPSNNIVNIGIITGDYVYNKELLSEYPHTRPVEWKCQIARDSLSDALRGSLRVIRTAANLSKHYSEINAFVNGESIQAKPQVLDLSYPLRPDFIVKFSIPANINEDEANRFSKYISTLYFS